MLFKRILLLGFASLLLCVGAKAQTYPNRPVRIIVPFGPGGPADIFARLLGQKLSEQLKQPFVVENKPGAGAVIGTVEVARAEPDGYTLLLMSNTHTANETLVSKKGYTLLKDLAPIAPINAADLVIVINPNVRAKNLSEFIALAKSKPKELNYASSGVGTPYHLAAENFKAMSGTDLVHVPHRGSGEARTSVIAGHVQMMIDSVTTMVPTVVGGQMRALAVTGKARSALLPDVPTAEEAGLKGYEATIWLGLMAPAATPRPIIDLLNSEVRKVQAQPEMKELYAKQGTVALEMSPDEFGEYIKADIAKWAKVIETARIKVD
ncbi:tripartite tricarboxylate transporter substrate binding protein [Methylocella sp. CPCC 101449]|uniref:tripartite tricarboxylate transporter substrate binding protein n=1 Tax=Methylocella sp. CPCC 101449 TaxID=2987531 RepID=UPI00288CF0D0|nr:tripartite tricarboxylate transporter substrate binding protein [Methylocella sp. CPCC 101449]MDT2023202.1 tripartite tricarboxylate transporter substrate binding protein [Methylocella sp. CPCC 101449]